MDLISYIRNIIDSSKREIPELYSEPKLIARNESAETAPITKVKSPTLTTPIAQETDMTWENPNFRNALLDSQIKTESNGNPNAKSNARDGGAVGLAQFMRGTWEDAKRMGWVDQDAERTDPTASLKAQKAFMSSLYSKDEMKKAKTNEERIAMTLASYNAGYGTLKNAIAKAENKGGSWLEYMPNETKKYIPIIMNRAEEEYLKSKENYVSKYKRD